MKKPTLIIHSRAPIRICDNGGWTDTWFAHHGRVFNIAVSPCVEVRLRLTPCAPGRERITIHARDYAQRYTYLPGSSPGRHPLLEAAIESLPPPADLSLQCSIHCEAPPGASTGTSAAVVVALVGALEALSTGRGMTPAEAARAAHRVETERLGLQCGIQDQLCAAHGGINFIEMPEYPHASVTPVPVSAKTRGELERRLSLVYLGRAHRSSEVHEMVIRSLEDLGAGCRQLEDLRQAAQEARDALAAGDLPALGRAMTANTQAQGRLHPALLSPEAERLFALARAHGALGWKVNGAGGVGGSVTILCGEDPAARRRMLEVITAENPFFREIPIHLSPAGLRVWREAEG